MATAVDPVCGKEIDIGQAEWLLLASDYDPRQAQDTRPGSNGRKSRRYYFCSTACKVKFDVAPGFYATLGEAPGLHVPPKAGWASP